MPVRLRVAMTLVVLMSMAGASMSKSAVSVSPPQPTTQDSVRVTVASGYPQSCWKLVPTACMPLSADTAAVVVQLQYCNGASSCSCPQFPFTYQQVCNFGPLPPGNYLARLDELHLNPNDPAQNRSESIHFVVEASTPAVMRTWGRLKTFYR